MFLAADVRVERFAKDATYVYRYDGDDMDSPNHPSRALHFAGMNYLAAATAAYDAAPATPAPAPIKQRTEFPLESLLRRTYHFRRTMRILLMRVEDAGGSGTREGCKLAVLLNRTYIDASDCYWRLRRQLDAIPLPF